jgi:hypothetical protein
MMGRWLPVWPSGSELSDSKNLKERGAGRLSGRKKKALFA